MKNVNGSGSGSDFGNFHNYADDLSNCLIHIYIAVNFIETKRTPLPPSPATNTKSHVKLPYNFGIARKYCH